MRWGQEKLAGASPCSPAPLLPIFSGFSWELHSTSPPPCLRDPPSVGAFFGNSLGSSGTGLSRLREMPSYGWGPRARGRSRVCPIQLVPPASRRLCQYHLPRPRLRRSPRPASVKRLHEISSLPPTVLNWMDSRRIRIVAFREPVPCRLRCRVGNKEANVCIH